MRPLLSWLALGAMPSMVALRVVLGQVSKVSSAGCPTFSCPTSTSSTLSTSSKLLLSTSSTTTPVAYSPSLTLTAVTNPANGATTVAFASDSCAAAKFSSACCTESCAWVICSVVAPSCKFANVACAWASCCRAWASWASVAAWVLRAKLAWALSSRAAAAPTLACAAPKSPLPGPVSSAS